VRPGAEVPAKGDDEGHPTREHPRWTIKPRRDKLFVALVAAYVYDSLPTYHVIYSFRSYPSCDYWIYRGIRVEGDRNGIFTEK
jgi:hypothetical protein